MRRLAVMAVMGVAAFPAFARASRAFDPAREAANIQKPHERPRLEPDSRALAPPTLALHYANRNGALISAHLWLPTGRSRKRLPVVVFINGDIAPETVYWYAAAAFARAGYIVLTYDPEGHGASESRGYGSTAMRHVQIQEEEGGAGDGPTDEDSVEQATDALDFMLSTAKHPYIPRRYDGKRYDRRHPTPGEQRQTLAVAAHQAAAFNPFWTRANAGRVGVVGHSRGADAVSIMAARERRIRAAVAFDDLQPQTFDTPPVPLRYRVPVLGIADDYYEVPTPFTANPDPQQHSGGFLAARRAGVDAAELVLRGATHYEFSYQAGLPLPATLRGVDFATWYATAWLDRYVKGDKRAVTRLLTDRWRHDSAEAAVDPTHDGNLFSFYFHSQLAVHQNGRLMLCNDLRDGCPELVPGRRDGGAGRYAVLVPEPAPSSGRGR